MLHVCTDLSCRLAGAEVPEGAIAVAVPRPVRARARLAADGRGRRAARGASFPETPPLPVHGPEAAAPDRAGVDPESRPEFRALERARELGPERVIELVKASPLLGRGGAAFPTGVEVGGGRGPAGAPALPRLQRRRVRAGHVQGSRPHGAAIPFALVEAIGDRRCSRPAARRRFIYVRAEYPLAHERMQEAIDASESASRSSCASAPARTSAARRRRSSSRSRATAASRATSRRSRSRSGCTGSRPSSTTSRRSLNVPHIVLEDDPRDTRLFCVSGHVARPGLYELELGTPLSRAARARRRRAAEGRPARRRGRLVPAARPARPAALASRAPATPARRSARAS